jgi:hypothetical protein
MVHLEFESFVNEKERKNGRWRFSSSFAAFAVVMSNLKYCCYCCNSVNLSSKVYRCGTLLPIRKFSVGLVQMAPSASS